MVWYMLWCGAVRYVAYLHHVRLCKVNVLHAGSDLPGVGGWA